MKQPNTNRPDPWVVGTDYHRDPWEDEERDPTDSLLPSDGTLAHRFGPITSEPIVLGRGRLYSSECSCGIEVAGSTVGWVIRKQDQHLGVIGGDAA